MPATIVGILGIVGIGIHFERGARLTTLALAFVRLFIGEVAVFDQQREGCIQLGRLLEASSGGLPSIPLGELGYPVVYDPIQQPFGILDLRVCTHERECCLGVGQ